MTIALTQRIRTTVHGSAVVVGDLCRSVAARAWGRTASAELLGWAAAIPLRKGMELTVEFERERRPHSLSALG